MGCDENECKKKKNQATEERKGLERGWKEANDGRKGKKGRKSKKGCSVGFDRMRS
jgi:hypothetical protein